MPFSGIVGHSKRTSRTVFVKEIDLPSPIRYLDGTRSVLPSISVPLRLPISVPKALLVPDSVPVPIPVSIPVPVSIPLSGSMLALDIGIDAKPSRFQLADFFPAQDLLGRVLCAIGS